MITTACGGGSGGSPTGPSNSGGSSGSGTPGSGGGSSPNGTLTATIDGVAWSATLGVQGINNNGILSISGSDSRFSLSLGIQVNRGTATYTLGTSDPFNITHAILNGVSPAGGWDAGPVSGSGSITLSTLTSTAASGTFSITVAPLSGTGATGNRLLANGTFNVPLVAPPTLPPGTPGAVNGTMTALVDGTSWEATFVSRAVRTGPVIGITGTSANNRTINITLEAGGPGTYSLNFPISGANAAVMTFPGQQWFTALAGGGGSVTISSLTSTRVTGTFTMTMQPSQANTPPIRVAQVTNGAFDLTF